LCYPEDIKVVILGMDPYHSNKYQANGIAFSVHDNVDIPPSLHNIFKELHNTHPSCSQKNGNLSHWVKHGVFLLNSALTVLQNSPGSHMSIWTKFTDHIIDIIQKHNDIVFCLWGRFAQTKEHLINPQTNIILKCSHPSPLSANRTDQPFIGSGMFLLINKHLADIITKRLFLNNSTSYHIRYKVTKNFRIQW
jgi:uracil-DNA glycosylase